MVPWKWKTVKCSLQPVFSGKTNWKFEIPPLRVWLGEVAIKNKKNITSNREPCTEILAGSKFQLLSWSDTEAYAHKDQVEEGWKETVGSSIRTIDTSKLNGNFSNVAFIPA